MQKKVVSILALIVLLVTVAGMAFAGGSASVAPCATGETMMSLKIRKSGSSIIGNATAVTYKTGCTAYVTASLQKKTGKNWTSVASDTKEKCVNLSVKLEKGVTYRIAASCVVKDKDGNVKDSIPLSYSSTITP